jgi:hypothetical protein
MPLRKLLGTKKPSDMMTKNVPCPTMELYPDMLNLKFAGGRAKIPQKLHSMGRTRARRANILRWRAPTLVLAFSSLGKSAASVTPERVPPQELAFCSLR